MNYFHLREVGILELLLASTMMLSGFTFKGLPLMLMMWPMMIGVLFLERKLQFRSFKPILIYIFYWIIHELVILVIDNNANINAFWGQIIYFVGFCCLYSHLNEKKLKGSFNWIAIISIIGLIVQWLDVLHGGLVHPLSIPGLDMPENRLDQEIPRPSSFFMEPAAFVSFMVIPLQFAIIDKKYMWITLIVLSIFLTTSTTGIIGVFIMIITSLFIHKRIDRTSIILLLLAGALFSILFTSDIFELGVEKLFETESGTNEHRLEQGAYIVSTMQPFEMLFGVPYSSAFNYCMSGRASDVAIYGFGTDASVYMSTFWYVILRFGLLGLFLYLNIYLSVYKKSRKILPLLAFMVAVMFSHPDNTGINYLVCLLVMLTICQDEINCIKVKKNVSF